MLSFRDNFQRHLPHQLPLAKNPVLNGIADLRSAIQAAVIARREHRDVCNSPFPLSEWCFGNSEAAEIDAVNVVRDALGALGLGPSEINQLGEILT